jgi:IS30 family transposase
MTTRYRQLQPEERVTIAALRQQNQSLRQIAVVLGRSPGTLSRELKRNSAAGAYSSSPAQKASEARRVAARSARKLDPDGRLWPVITHMLCWLWSPQQIARTLRAMWPDEPDMQVSHETI